MQKPRSTGNTIGLRRLALVVLSLACVNLNPPPEIELVDAASTPRRDTAAAVDAGADRLAPDAGALADLMPAEDAAGSPLDTPDAAPDTSPDAPLFDNGQRCAEAGQCRSRNCVDGVCCASACTQACSVCNAAGMEGACTPVLAGEDPGNECTQDPAASCAYDGTCDGRGACRRTLAGTECTAGRCTDSTEYAAGTCDGAGTCRPGASRSCSPNLCMGSSCASTCSGDSACQAGFFCESGTCRAKRAVGAACARIQECGSGYCVDGICCNSACTQRCSSCALAAAPGTCTAAASGQDPRNECPAQAASTCGRAGGCDGAGTCRLHAAGTSCAGPSCSGSQETAGSSCNGLGSCLPGATRDCSPYLCGSGACATSCTSSAGCAAGYACSGGGCVLAGLAFHWKFDEPSGTSAADASGNGRNGTYLGDSGIPAPSSSVPPITFSFSNPRSRAFAQASRHAVLLDPMPAALKTESFTLSAWFRATAADTNGSEIISGGNDYFLRLHPTQLEFAKRISLVSGSMFALCRPTFSGQLDGQWHHIAGVNGPAGMRVYFDGVEACTNTRTEPMLYTGSELAVGRHGGGLLSHDFDGNIDDVRIYTRPLSAAEVQSLARGGP